MNQFSPAYSNRNQDRKIRFGLVGCGRISKNHIGAMQQHEDSCELVGVCDVDPRALESAAGATGAKAYRSLEAMLADCKADAFVLATPSGLHSSQAIQVAQAGRHVVTEKPMATRWEDGKRMVAACDEARVRLFVVKQNRLNTTLQLLKKAIEDKRFGKINMVNLNVFWTRPQEYYDSAKWRGTWEYDGGAFMNQASHYVDLVEWLIGPVESLHAYTATLQRNIEVEDTGVLSLRWRNGALGSVNVTMLTWPKNLEGSITVLGERGTVRIGGVALNEVQHWEFADRSEDDDKVKTASYETGSVYGFGHARYYDNVIKVLRGEAEPETDGREGLKTLEVLIATYLSARDGKRIALPMEY
ncbi:MAG TPA: Gfo/Idh/MocA family oxidoreductase [Noviherbaspirillum sp.]|uniref:Gfo/Idh/MocA family protein n=1 Tax=Noviherbaspirillum sp. TaxID=1926288 RepID=UPI002B4852DF|nr:Gfo/Idh/MocA family oxidoreductase [Noviherbaspirillum sp.]HJV84455.1 Gfo/Idh/MocA family oxidoreductase [Noviherbaspirillum sp.]